MPKAPTFDQAQERFREKRTRRAMDMYFRTALDYHEDGMIGDRTYKAVQKECVKFLSEQAAKKKMPAAQLEAMNAAKLNGFKGPSVGVQKIDTEFPARPICYMVMVKPSCAVVVYEDDPLTVVSTGNRKGRFVSAGAA